jgi:PAS domain S-box-containing protein
MVLSVLFDRGRNEGCTMEGKGEARGQFSFEEAAQALVEHSVQGLLILQDERIVYANPAAVRISGYSQEELRAFRPGDVWDLLDPQGREGARQRMWDRLAGKALPPRSEHRFVRKDGTVCWVEALASPITYRGQPALQVAYIDITERKQAEEATCRSIEQTARGQRLLLALSRAAQAVERARTTDEVYRLIGQQVSALGYQATILTLSEDRAQLIVSHLTFDPQLLHTVEGLTGVPALGYRFPLAEGGLHQRVIEGQEPVFTGNDSRSVLEAMPGMAQSLTGQVTSMLGREQGIIAPLIVGGEVHGLLAVTGSGLTEADLPAVATFANQAAIAIENARLLETVTKQRQELHALSSRLIEAQEEERGRISRELHDEIGQALTAMSINLAEIEKRLPPELDRSVAERLAETATLIEETSEHIGALALDLRPSMLDDLGLIPALRWYLSRYSDRLGIEVELQVTGMEGRVAREIETALYRVIQEAMTNVARHAGAMRVRLSLERRASSVVATIEDDGRGFDEKALAERKPTERGAGLVGMQERITLLGGCFCVESVLGEGTRLFAEIPL